MPEGLRKTPGNQNGSMQGSTHGVAAFCCCIEYSGCSFVQLVKLGMIQTYKLVCAPKKDLYLN